MINNTTLGEITISIFDGKHGDCENQHGSGLYFISVKDLRDYDINYAAAREITLADFRQNYLRTNFENGDTIFANTGDTIGKSIFVKDNLLANKTSFQKSVAILKPNLKFVEPRYLYYLMKYETPRLRKASTGSGQKNLLLSTMRDFEVKIHDRNTQKKISSTLGLIDDKIRCNIRVNDNLEKQLRTIYDYWFTQFDFPDENGKPYRSSGGKMVWNDELKREIPEGWECRTLSSLLHRHQQAFDYKSEQPTVDLSIMPTASIAIEQTNSSSMFATNLYWMDEGDLLFGSIRPYLKKAGIAPCNGVVAGTVHCFQVNDKHDYNFALFTLCGKNMFDYAVKLSKGTKMPVVSAEDILSYKVPYSKEISRLFNAFSIQKTICNNVKEIQKLTKLRDWLLPMLMNGQATVAD